jgi:hypothetical protein
MILLSATPCLTPNLISMLSAGMWPRNGIFPVEWLLTTTCRWDDDVIFKNQARGTEDKRKKEFVNVSPFKEFYIITQEAANSLG